MQRADVSHMTYQTTCAKGVIQSYKNHHEYYCNHYLHFLITPSYEAILGLGFRSATRGCEQPTHPTHPVVGSQCPVFGVLYSLVLVVTPAFAGVKHRTQDRAVVSLLRLRNLLRGLTTDV